MLRRGTIAAVLGTAALVALVGAAEPTKPTTEPVPTLKFTPSAGFTPRVLSKSSPTPIALTIAANVATIDRSHPPALQELAIQFDKNISINLTGYPTCHFLGQQVDPPMTPQEECRGAFVGKGTAHFEIRLEEAEPIRVRSGLQIFNLGRKNGIPTLAAVTRIPVPTPALLIATIRIKGIHDGHYGSEATITFPKIAGGSGSITSLDLRLKKQLPFNGKRFSPIAAKCPDGKLQLHDTAAFFNYETAETSMASAELLRNCTGR